MDIINITKEEDAYMCLICGDRNTSELKKLRITRSINSQNVVSFTICDKCLQRLKNELNSMEE